MWKLNTKLRHLLVAVLTLSNLLYPTTIANTAPNSIGIISITESSNTSTPKKKSPIIKTKQNTSEIKKSEQEKAKLKNQAMAKQNKKK